MHKNPFTAVMRFIALAGTLSVMGAQADGRIEINQASVEAAGGFPYTISEPGSYVLTGPLVVPAETNGLVIATSYVTIDLNGFSISGPASCTPSECRNGDGFGIVPQNFLTHATRSTVRNGIVRGFSGFCVLLTSGAKVEDLMVSECGLIGISAGVGVVTGNRVIRTGQAGLSMAANTTFANNYIANAGLGGGGARAVEGGRASTGNSCDDFSCSPRGERRYYLTDGFFEGNEALGACATGFHMASLWELFETSTLYYDADLGFAFDDDAGSGPPTYTVGWVRTGSGSADFEEAGRANCGIWTSDTVDDFGTIVRPDFAWSNAARTSSPWEPETSTCNINHHVWCVED